MSLLQESCLNLRSISQLFSASCRSYLYRLGPEQQHRLGAKGGVQVNRAKKRAARLAIFIECAGQVPIIRGSAYSHCCKFLEEQYMNLEPEARRRARVEGRRRIREQGVEALAIRLIPVPPPTDRTPMTTQEERLKQRAKYQEKIRRWG